MSKSYASINEKGNTTHLMKQPWYEYLSDIIGGFFRVREIKEFIQGLPNLMYLNRMLVSHKCLLTFGDIECQSKQAL